MKIASWFLHPLRLFFSPAVGLHSTSGKWRVRYDTGELTRGMTYREAVDMASMFHGTVEPNPPL